MGWKYRRDRRYYYRSIRTTDGVRSEYVGAGPLAECDALLDKQLASRAELERSYWLEATARFKTGEQSLNNWLRTVRRVLYTTIQLWGYHEHKREWRLARQKAKTMEITGTTKEPVVTYERVMELVKAKKLTSAQEDELEAGLKSFPLIVNNLGDIGALLRRQMISTMTQQPGVGVVWNAKVQTLRKEMGYADAAPSERLVIDTVVTCWLHLQAAESGYQNFCKGGGTPVQVAAWEGRLSSAQNRFARQVELLAKLRYWGSRIHQVNIAQNMIVSNS